MESERLIFHHIPVMAGEVVDLLGPTTRHLDGTLGLGGHAYLVMERNPTAQLCGLDRDGEALVRAETLLRPFGRRCRCFHQTFGEFPIALRELRWERVDTALLDLGVSSLQLDAPERGFSFRHDGPLDMRMDGTKIGKKAWELVNRTPYEQLREWLTTLGEEPQGGRIARAIVERRQKGGINSTAELADVVRMAYPGSWRRSARRHPATRSFQALRMVVNGELDQLKLFLEQIWSYMATGGRLAIISFHSLEDRLVKHAMRSWAKAGRAVLITRKPLRPGMEEIAANPRASSAKMRVAEKV